MSTGLIAGYNLSVANNVVSIHDSLESAMSNAGSFMTNKSQLSIYTATSPIIGAGTASAQAMPVQTWNFDYELNRWVERVR